MAFKHLDFNCHLDLDIWICLCEVKRAIPIKSGSYD